MSRVALRIRSPGSQRRVVLLFNERGVPPPDRPDTVLVKERRAQIGASSEADLQLTSPGVAPQHCSLESADGKLILRDRGSKTKTMVNGAPCLEPTVLTVGDLVGVGQTTLELIELTDKTEAPPPRKSRPREDEIRLQAQVATTTRAAQQWELKGRRHKLLARGKLLVDGATLYEEAADDFDPLTVCWLTNSAERATQRDHRRSLGMGLGLGLLVGYLLLPPPAPPSQAIASSWLSPPRVPALDTPRAAPPAATETRCLAADYEVRTGDTWELLSSRFSEPVDVLQRRNGNIRGLPETGTYISVCTAQPVLSSTSTHLVERGESWEMLARKFGVNVEHLKAANPDLPQRLRPGDRIEFEKSREDGEAPALRRAQTLLPDEVDDATAVGATNDGFLANGIRLPALDDYFVRCQPHSYGTKFTVESIIAAASRMRQEFDYQGELIIGDLSKRSGGSYGPHRSHQNGRDVDVWLPVRDGQYARAPSCVHCNTDYCRPSPDEVDWDATWQLVKALAAIGEDKDKDEESPVKEIFLDKSLHDELAAAASRDGVSDKDLRGYVQYRGRNALVKHSDGHIHHIHVRFRCGDKNTGSCVE